MFEQWNFLFTKEIIGTPYDGDIYDVTIPAKITPSQFFIQQKYVCQKY